MRTADDIVRQEVIYCVSSLVHTLAATYSCPHVERQPALKEIDALADQAFELAASVPDYEEAAREAGWTEHAGPFRDTSPEGFGVPEEPGFIKGQIWDDYTDWQELCEAEDIEPHDREVYEHWIVTDWLADKLEAKGEKVDRDFAGMIVWARTTTGQSIAMDGIMQAIAADVARDYAALVGGEA